MSLLFRMEFFILGRKLYFRKLKNMVFTSEFEEHLSTFLECKETGISNQ